MRATKWRWELRIQHLIDNQKIQPQVLTPSAVHIHPLNPAKDLCCGRGDDLNGKLVREAEVLVVHLPWLYHHYGWRVRCQTQARHGEQQGWGRARASDDKGRDNVAQSGHRGACNLTD